jgi:hypothetical protein
MCVVEDGQSEVEGYSNEPDHRVVKCKGEEEIRDKRRPPTPDPVEIYEVLERERRGQWDEEMIML